MKDLFELDGVESGGGEVRRWLYVWVAVCRSDLRRICCLVWGQGTNISRGRQRRWLLPGYSIALVPKVGEIFENRGWGSCSEDRRRV